MGNNIIARQIEELYVFNQILVPKYKDENGETTEMPNFTIFTLGANDNRTKVYATVSLENIPFGEMSVYMLHYGKNGEISKHDFIGKAGYHIAGVGQQGRIFEYNPKEKGNMTEARLKMIGGSTSGVTRAVEEHVKTLQADFVSGKN